MSEFEDRGLASQALANLKGLLLLADIEAAAEILPNPDLDWTAWNNTLMLLWAVSNGRALEAAHTFSKKSKKYDPAETDKRWREIGKSPPTRMNVGSLVFKVRKVVPDWIPPSERNTPPTSRGAAAPVVPPRASGSWRDSMVSAANLRTMTFEPVRYVVPGFIVEGVTLLVGRPKIGKSWWVLDVCLGVAIGCLALGKLNALQGDVLYLALEDGKRRLQKRLDKLLPTFNGGWPEGLKLVPMGGWRRADQGGLEDIREWCKSVPKPILVVVDTLERLRKPANGKAPLYSADYEAITGLQKIANEFGIAIIALHHDRKSDADDAFDTVSGTLGLTGAADTTLIIKRRSNGVVLYAIGRDIEGSETAMQFDKATCRWTVLGVASEVLRSNERARVISAITAAGQPLSVREIMADAEMPNRNAVDILLGKMVRDGEIVRVGRGRYDLSTKINGQIGQKERSDGKATDFIGESGNLSNLSDLSARTDKPPLS
ncbi:MAG: AAA family ATPase [Methylocella sp.]